MHLRTSLGVMKCKAADFHDSTYELNVLLFAFEQILCNIKMKGKIYNDNLHLKIFLRALAKFKKIKHHGDLRERPWKKDKNCLCFSSFNITFPLCPEKRACHKVLFSTGSTKSHSQPCVVAHRSMNKNIHRSIAVKTKRK